VSSDDVAADRPAGPVPGQAARERLEHALDLAYRHLARRDRTVAQVRRHLERRGVDLAIADQAVAELARQGYLDDARFARRFVEDRRTLDAWGGERIARGLQAAGVPHDLAVAALSATVASSELDAAAALLRRRLSAPPATDRERNRALGLLVRKGYELETAYDAIRAVERGAD